MKKIIVAAAAALLAVGAQAATYKDGSYTGEGKGRESVITVQVDVKGGKIADVKVVKHGETEMIIAAPIEQMIPEIVKKNGVEGVDSVGGATLSSEGSTLGKRRAGSRAAKAGSSLAPVASRMFPSRPASSRAASSGLSTRSPSSPPSGRSRRRRGTPARAQAAPISRVAWTA